MPARARDRRAHYPSLARRRGYRWDDGDHLAGNCTSGPRAVPWCRSSRPETHSNAGHPVFLRCARIICSLKKKHRSEGKWKWKSEVRSWCTLSVEFLLILGPEMESLPTACQSAPQIFLFFPPIRAPAKKADSFLTARQMLADFDVDAGIEHLGVPIAASSVYTPIMRYVSSSATSTRGFLTFVV